MANNGSVVRKNLHDLSKPIELRELNRQLDWMWKKILGGLTAKDFSDGGMKSIIKTVENTVAEEIAADTIETNVLVAALAEMMVAKIGVAKIDYAQIVDLFSERIFTDTGIAGHFRMDGLEVTQAQIVDLIVSSFRLVSQDGKVYKVSVDANGEIVTEYVEDEAEWMEDGKVPDGYSAVASSLTVGNVTSGNLYVSGAADIMKLTAKMLTVDKGFINELTSTEIFASYLMANQAFVELLRTSKIVSDKSLVFIAGEASDAMTAANSAGSAASKAQSTADSASAAASNAQSTADSASSAASKAQSAADSASQAASNAQSTADTAKANAATAQSTANSAKTTADNASTAAANAQSIANTANTTANSAKTAAANAQSTADTAKANAATAQTTADTAKANAATAQSTANTANSTANTAKTAAANAQTTANDALAKSVYDSNTAPSSPSTGKLWLDRNAIPCVLRRWTGSEWETVNDVTLIETVLDAILTKQDYLESEQKNTALYLKLDNDMKAVRIGQTGLTSEARVDAFGFGVVVANEVFSRFESNRALFGNMEMRKPNAGGLAIDAIT